MILYSVSFHSLRLLFPYSELNRFVGLNVSLFVLKQSVYLVVELVSYLFIPKLVSTLLIRIASMHYAVIFNCNV